MLHGLRKIPHFREVIKTLFIYFSPGIFLLLKARIMSTFGLHGISLELKTNQVTKNEIKPWMSLTVHFLISCKQDRLWFLWGKYS